MDDIWGILQYIFMIICLLSHYIAIIYSCYKKRNSYQNYYKHWYTSIIKKYLRFVICYSIIWIVPSVYGFLLIIGYTSSWISYAVLVGVASPGIANGILWKCNNNTMTNNTTNDPLLNRDTKIESSITILSKDDHGPHSETTKVFTITMMSKDGQMS